MRICKDQETVPFMAFGVLPAMAKMIMTRIAKAMTMIRQIMSRSVYICFAKYFKCFSALD